jgi:hypothetical protein
LFLFLGEGSSGGGATPQGTIVVQSVPTISSIRKAASTIVLERKLEEALGSLEKAEKERNKSTKELLELYRENSTKTENFNGKISKLEEQLKVYSGEKPMWTANQWAVNIFLFCEL